MNKLFFVLLSFVLISVMSFSQENTRVPFSDNTWKALSIQNDGLNSIFLDDMNGDNTVAGLQARGWVVLDEDGGGTTPPWNQGDITVFEAYEGPTNGYTFTNYQGANGFLIDQWLISPEIIVNTGDTLSFWYRSPDGSTWDDSLYIRYSTTAGITPADFDQTWGRYYVPITGWTRWTGIFNHSGTIRFAIQYYITDGGPSGNNSNYVGIDYIEVISAGGSSITIAEAIEDLNNDFIPDRLGQTVTIEGVVFSPNYQTTHNSYYIHDGTAGTDIFMYGPPLLTWNFGDKLQITGEVSQYNGMTEIIPADSSGWVFQSSGNPTANYTVITLGQYKANPEMYEGSLVGFISLNKVSGTWPGTGSSVNLNLTDGIDTVVFRIDSDTDIDGQPEPTWPRDVIGIGSQFDSSPPYNGGYQVFPRYYATDFLPPGTIPVELTSFSAIANYNNVLLRWSTATELNNSGFEIQRSTQGNEFSTIGFVPGHGTTSDAKNYSFTDANLSTGTYSYRLKQVDYNGTFLYSEIVNVDVTAPAKFGLAQNYPNPFNPETNIKFSLPQSSEVTLKIFNALGQEVRTLVNQFMESGSHTINFNASDLNSGIYFYKLDAGQFTEVKKMTLIK
jgi:hypothetical protein